MPLFWVVLQSLLPLLALCSGPDRCPLYESSSQHVSPVMESLRCHNDYQSYVHCSWREELHVHAHLPLQLWVMNHNNNSASRCKPYSAPNQTADKHRTVQCRYETDAFSIGIKHTFFFQNRTLTVCLSVPRKPLELLQHLKVRPPVNLSSHGAADGGRELQWFSPYPPSSALNQNLTYQLSYRRDEQDDWTVNDVTDTHLKLEGRSLSPRCQYEARVRARATVGQWSDWSLVETWRTAEAPGHLPRLHCVLDGEKEVMCSWEVKRELAHFITHQLACRHNQTAEFERCCFNPTVTFDLRGAVLRYSCSLNVADPALLQLQLQPTHNTKTFKAHKHIHPSPPHQVWVREKDRNWIVEWTEPSADTKFKMFYQVNYYSTQGSGVLQNISEGSTSLSILGESLLPSHQYQVRVRSLVVPGEGSRYEGTPSEWTEAVGWTSHSDTRPLYTLLYIFIGVVVAAVFLTLYCTIPACRRKAILWVESVPSPGKSKILSDIKFSSSQTFEQNETTHICKVQNLDSLSTCSSHVSLWSSKNVENKLSEINEVGSCWICDNQPDSAERSNSSGVPSISFSGPYILCQTSLQNEKSVDVQEKKEEKISLDDSAPPSPEQFFLRPEDYVCLPTLCRSMQDLISHSGDHRTSNKHEQPLPDTKERARMLNIQPGIKETTKSQHPPPCTPGPFTTWPRGGSTQASGYCCLP
ncbi:hypothetical protein LDENG_00044760 [Lucifuga dentata]|nr:hypothetical protein LDENG_00044760 [Lucifuga dentata]